MAQTLQDVIAKDRERLNSEREAIRGQQRELESKLAAIDREFAAIEAYEAAKTGKTPARQTSGRRAPAARKGSKRDGVMQVLKEHPGLTRGELLEKMGLRGDKSGEMSVSNALTALTKSNQVRRDGGKYFAA